jgi:hypothetical protein
MVGGMLAKTPLLLLLLLFLLVLPPMPPPLLAVASGNVPVVGFMVGGALMPICAGVAMKRSPNQFSYSRPTQNHKTANSHNTQNHTRVLPEHWYMDRVMLPWVAYTAH